LASSLKIREIVAEHEGNPLALHLFGMFLWPLVASFLSLMFDTSFVTSTILYLAVPCLYLAALLDWKIGRTLWFSAILAVPMGIIMDYVMEITGGWVLEESLFDYKFLGYVFLEQIAWLVLYVFFVAAFHRLFGRSLLLREKRIKPFKLRWLGYWYGSMLGAFYLGWLIEPDALRIDYFYLKVGCVLEVLPLAYTLLRYPFLWRLFVLPTVYFLYVGLQYEFVALHLHHWSFPVEEQFLGMIDLYGLRFPLEELVFWMLIGAAVVISYYELFVSGDGNSSQSMRETTF
jgi:hypothetical protein